MSKEGLAETVPLLKARMSNGVGFLRVQINSDVMQVAVMSIDEVTPALVQKLTEPFYDEETGTHGYHEILSLALYLAVGTEDEESGCDEESG
jgi:hypothetical protein